MDYRNELAAELPTPRDDEPAGLRQDIVDELADHLACAYNRELLRGAETNEARRRVLDRFGDPRAVARRLWLDAIGGKIMAQRVLIATCLVVALVSIGLVGVMSQQAIRAQGESARAAWEAIQALNAQNARAQASQQEMLKQLREMSEAIKSTRSFDWNPVSFKLTEKTLEGPPAVGFAVHLSEKSENGVKMTPRVSNGQGIVEFVGVRPGEYAFQITKLFAQAEGSLIVEPGSQIKKQIICPEIPLERVPVRIRAAWPAGLEKEGLVLFAGFELDPILHDGVEWSFNGLTRQPGVFSHCVLCGPGVSIAEVLDRHGPYKWGMEEKAKYEADLLSQNIEERDTALSWERGVYQLADLLVLRPQESTGVDGPRRFAIVAYASAPWLSPKNTYGLGTGSPWSVEERDTPPTEAELIEEAKRETVMRVGGFRNVPRIDLPEQCWFPIEKSFEARPGQSNEWTIPLPDELIAIVRKSREAAR